MLMTNSNKRFLKNIANKIGSKWSDFKNYTNNVSLSLGDAYIKVKDYLTAKYNRLARRLKVRKYQFGRKLRQKWKNKWVHYYNYMVWTFTPYVLVYGLALNFVAAQLGLLPLTPGNLVASGITTYFVKEEFPEWMNGIEWLHKDQSSEV